VDSWRPQPKRRIRQSERKIKCPEYGGGRFVILSEAKNPSLVGWLNLTGFFALLRMTGAFGINVEAATLI
jgi:hypothetical protein